MGEEEKKLQVLHVEIENVLRVREATFDPKENDLVLLQGANESGKTSIIEALKMALGGRMYEPEKPIHADNARGRVYVILGDNGKPEYQLELTLKTGDASTFRLKNADGLPIQRPRETLDLFLKSLSFSPLDFASPPGAKTAEATRKVQREMLLRACPLNVDLDALNAQVKEAYQERTEQNRIVKTWTESAGPLVPADIPVPEPVDDRQVENALVDARKHNSDIEKAAWRLQGAGEAVANVNQQMMQCQKDYVDLQEKIQKLTADRELRVAEFGKAREAVKPEVDTTPLELAVHTARQSNLARAVALSHNQALADRRERRKQFVARATAASKAAEELDDRMLMLNKKKEAALAEAHFPHKGLGLDEVGVTLDGIPFSQASGARRIEVSLAVAAALNPTFRTILCDEAVNVMDDASLARVRDWARANGYQIISTTVTKRTADAILIEDGEVKS